MTYNIETHRGDTYKGATFEVIQDGLPIDLTGYTIRMQLRPSKSSSILALDLTDSIEIHDPANGLFRINEVLIELTPRIYHYDIEVTKDGVVSTWVEGVFTVIQDVTR